MLNRIRRRLWIIVLCAIVGAAVAYQHANSKPTSYEASAQLLFGTNQTVLAVLNLPSGAAGLSTATQATNASLAALPVISADTAKALGSHVPPGGVNVNAVSDGTTNLVEVQAKSATPADAIAVANAYANQAVIYQQQQQLQQLQAGIAGIKRGIAARRAQGLGGGTLSISLGNLTAIAAVNPVDVYVAQPATSATIVSNKAKTKALEGLLLGAIVGVIIALLLDWLDPKLRDVSEDEFHGLQVITLEDLPKQGGYEATTGITRRLLTAAGDGAPPQLIAITSPGKPQDVQSARQLALAVAQTAAANGLSAGIVRVAKASSDSEGDSAAELTRTKLMDGVEATDISPRALLSGAAARDLEAELRETYRVIVVIDERPSEFSAVAPLVRAADVSVLVVTLGKTTRRDAAAAARTLVQMGSANATLVALPSGFRATLQKSGALQPVS